jgi:hypothetical protein
VVRDPREDAATKNQICTRQQKRGENRHIGALGLMLERVGGDRSEKGCGQGESNKGGKIRGDTWPTSVFCGERSRSRAIQERMLARRIK